MVFLFIFILGVLIGSFLNVVGLRWNSGMGLHGRSFCAVCAKQLAWWELMPVLSFIALRGKCSECKTRISAQYILVEVWTGLLFLSIYMAMPVTREIISIISYALLVIVFCIYVVITIYDARHKIIPDELSYAAIFVALIYRIIIGGDILDYIAGPILFIFFGSFWYFSHGRAMGLGDAKLGLSIGLILGFSMGLSGIAVAFWIGSAFALTSMALSRSGKGLFAHAKGLTMKSELPFAPFLIVGAWVSLIYHLDLFHVSSF